MNGWLLGGILAWLFGLTVGSGVLMWATSRLYDLVIRLEDKILDHAIQDRMADCCNTRNWVTPGGIPYTVHEAACRALYEVPVVVHDGTDEPITEYVASIRESND